MHIQTEFTATLVLKSGTSFRMGRLIPASRLPFVSCVAFSGFELQFSHMNRTHGLDRMLALCHLLQLLNTDPIVAETASCLGSNPLAPVFLTKLI